MLNRVRPHLTYANVMVTVLAFIVLGGGVVVAADKLGSKDIANNAIKSKHIANGQVKNKDLAASALGCPKGMRRLQGLCYEKTANPADDNLAARYTCAQKGRQLPTIAEMLRIAHSGAFPSDGVEKWTSTNWADNVDGELSKTVTKHASNNIPTLNRPNVNNFAFHCIREATP